MRPPVPRGSRELPKPRPRPPGGHLAQPRGPQIFQSLLNFSRYLFRFFRGLQPFFIFFQFFSIGFIVSSLFSIFSDFFSFFQLFFRVPLGGAGVPGFLRVSWGSLGGATAHARGDAVFFPFFNFFQIFADSPDFFSDVFQSSAWQGRISRVLACFLGVSRGSDGAHPRRCSFFFSFFSVFLQIVLFFGCAYPPAHRC